MPKNAGESIYLHIHLQYKTDENPLSMEVVALDYLNNDKIVTQVKPAYDFIHT